MSPNDTIKPATRRAAPRLAEQVRNAVAAARESIEGGNAQHPQGDSPVESDFREALLALCTATEQLAAHCEQLERSIAGLNERTERLA
jgi:hypothetical protein